MTKHAYTTALWLTRLFEPTVALLVHRMPGGQVIRHHPPCCPRSDDPAQAVKDLAQTMVLLEGLFGDEG